MPAGRPSQPIEVKRRRGRSPGKDSGGRDLPAAVVTLVPSVGVPRPPDSLGDVGREVWVRLWGAASGYLSTQTDIDVVTRLCEAHDERQAMSDQIALDGYMIEGSTGRRRVHPLVAQRQVLQAQMTAWESLLGFNPAARAKLGLAEVKTVSKLDELMARRRKASGG